MGYSRTPGRVRIHNATSLHNGNSRDPNIKTLISLSRRVFSNQESPTGALK